MGLDAKQLRVTALRAARQYAAMRRTIKGDCEGRVVVSRRKKLPGEKSRVIHGKFIANLLADKGKDPFVYPPDVEKRALGTVEHMISQSLLGAFRAAKADAQALKKALLAGARIEVSWVKEHILSGGLGGNTASTQRQKERLAQKGLADPLHTNTYGVRSRRFVDGIRESFKQIFNRT